MRTWARSWLASLDTQGDFADDRSGLFDGNVGGIERQVVEGGVVHLYLEELVVEGAPSPIALHVLLVAPLAHRLEEVIRREGLTEEAAAKQVHEGDRGRSAFHDKFFKIKVDDPSLYHLTLNTAHVPIEEAAAIISEVALRIQRGQP